MAKRVKQKDPTIVLRDNGWYYFMGSIPGAVPYGEHALRTKSYAEAKLRKLDLIARLSRAGSVAIKTKAEPIMLRYLAHEEKRHKGGEISKRTIQECQHIINSYLRPFFGRHKLEEIDSLLFEKYTDRKKMDYANHRKYLNKFLKYCKKHKYLKGDLPTLELPKWERKGRNPLTNEEVLAIFRLAKGNFKLYAMMYLFMGMRSSEITKLEWDRVDFSTRAIFLGKLNVKTKKARVIPINAEVLKILTERRLRAKGPYVFPNQRSKVGKTPHMHPGGFRPIWNKLLAEAGIKRKLSPHDLRATWETFTHTNINFTDTQREKMAGAAIDVQKDIYVRLQVDKLRGLEEAVKIEGLDDILSGKSLENVVPLKRKSQ